VAGGTAPSTYGSETGSSKGTGTEVLEHLLFRTLVLVGINLVVLISELLYVSNILRAFNA
jgi:hypothetical protein